MIMESTRLFIGNLPPGITQHEIQTEFGAYGNVKNVELKCKENIVDPKNPSFFAFVTIDANQYQIKQCIGEFQQEEFRGRFLKVSVARESFLDRLKREREEAAPKKPSNHIVEKDSQKIDKVKVLPTLKKDKVDSSSSSSPESEDESKNSSSSEDIKAKKRKIVVKENKYEELDHLISKKRASNSLQNGKIKIQKSGYVEPIHVIKKKEKIIKNNLDDKGKAADKKRKESLFKMKDQYTKQKLAIQQSLSATDSNKQKIRFDEYQSDVSIEDSYNKIDLFDDEEDDNNKYENDFELKEQFQGKKGEKLMKLQSNFKLDTRFKMDTKFMEDDDSNDDDDKQTIEKQNDEPEDDMEAERKWQLGILEQVVGHKINSKPKRTKNYEVNMQRYDPNNKSHEKYVIQEPILEVPKTKKTSKALKDNKEIRKIESVEVSKEQFFKISDDLTNSLKRRGDGFSLLSMFGRDHEDHTENQNIYEEKILVSSKPEKQCNPYKFDSSDSEEDETNESVKKSKTEMVSDGKSTVNGVWTENLFFAMEDQRLFEGAEFFKSIKQNEDETKEDYDKVKNKLRNIIHKKISKTKKNLQINNKNSNRKTNIIKKK